MADGTLVLQRVSFHFDEEKSDGIYFDKNEMIYTRLDGAPPKIVDVLPVYRERELLTEGGSSIRHAVFTKSHGGVHHIVHTVFP